MKVTIHAVHPPIGEAAVFGTEPKWAVGYEPTNYSSELGRALSWHARCASNKDLHKYIQTWITVFRSKTAPQDLTAWGKVSDSAMTEPTLPSLARIRIRGFPVKQDDLDKIWEYASQKISEAKTSPTKRQAPAVPIKDRIKNQVEDSLGAVDELLDLLAAGEQPDLTPFKTELLKPEFKGPHMKEIVRYVDSVMAEFVELQQARKIKTPTDDQAQLIEGYSYLKPRTLTRLINTLTELRDSIGKQVSKTAAQKIRKKKPLDRQKVVSKLRFKREDAELGLKGVDPLELLGATSAWIYDTKKRKLHYVVGEHAGSLSVGGPKLRGLGKASNAKTLRKPEVQLREFMGLKKNQILPWFENIKAKASPSTGRSTEDMILLKVI
jgi:hypothetical protein